MYLKDFNAYADIVYSLQETHPSIQTCTLVLASIGPRLAKLEGQLIFRNNVVLDVWELVDFEARRIRNYSYEIYHANNKLAWYDPFEHPELSELADTYPHHKHIPPDIRENRIPASGISFEKPNLPLLIKEIEREMLPSYSSP